MKTFEELGVSEQIRRAISELGFEQPMPVQEQVIPYLLNESPTPSPSTEGEGSNELEASPSGGGLEGASYLLASGGSTRFHSVQNGLAQIPDDTEGVVGVHDGVRPFASVEVIARCYDEARRSKAVVPVVPVVESLRHISEGAKTRADYRLVQTPQVFDIQLLKRAYCQPFNESFTDDASVVESLGHSITMVEGNRENIKITTPFDLRIAETLVQH